jgi:hypothetical protein
MKDDQSPATKADLFRLETATKADLLRSEQATKIDIASTKADLLRFETETKANFQYVNKKIDKLDTDIDKVLQILINMSADIKPQVKDHERRIKRLEKHSGLAVASSK